MVHGETRGIKDNHFLWENSLLIWEKTDCDQVSIYLHVFRGLLAKGLCALAFVIQTGYLPMFSLWKLCCECVGSFSDSAKNWFELYISFLYHT